MKTRVITRLLIAGTAGLLLAVAAPLAAIAHVTINPNSAEPGSYTVVTVKVPNESATASTAKVEFQLPTDTPFPSVRYVPVAGWSAELVKTTLPKPVMVGAGQITEAITSVVWTADPGFEIGDGQLQQFSLSLGPVPDVGSVVLPATQTYTDGKVVEWTETEANAEHPAPILYINDAPAADHHGAATSDDDSAPHAAADTAGEQVDVAARVLGVLGLLAGTVGIVLALVRRRSSAN